MPSFAYSARRSSGDLVSGTEAAADRDALATLLSGRGLLLVEAKPERGGLPSFRAARVSPAQMQVFVEEFRHLLDAGIGVAPALDILKDRPSSPVLAEGIAALLDKLNEGAPLDQAAASRSDIFDTAFQAALGVGQRTAKLSEALERYGRYLTIRAELRRKIRKALAYPIFLAVLLVVVLAILMLFVLPRFAALYADFGTDLPWATQVLVNAVDSAPIWLGAIAATFVLVPLIRRAIRSTDGGALMLDRLTLTLPLSGPIARDLQLVQISYMLSSLLQSGAQMPEALKIVQSGTSNRAMRAELTRLRERVGEGKSFSDAAEAVGLFPPLSFSMIRAGDMSGSLASLLDAVSTVHEKRAEDRMARLLALIEPTIMAIVGIVLGAVVISVYLPIFGISGVVQ